MYSTLGANPNELGDIDVIEQDGKIHLFHLVLPNHDLIAHATSTDGLSWTPAPAALRTGDPGECDDDMIWTMHTVKKPEDSGFYMYYTACCTKEHGQVQRVALAESPDLMVWKKYPHNPILESKNPYYNEDRELVGFISFRDPFVFIEDDIWHMLVCAREKEGARFRRGCIAHATSPDGLHWALQPPLYAPQQHEDLEVPSLLKLNGRYYLFFNILSVGINPYRIAESLQGPWIAPERDELLPQHNAVFRFCRWKGRILLYHWLRSEADWPRRGGAGYASLAPPKELEVDENGELRLVSFSGWSKYHQGNPQSLSPDSFLKRVSGPGEPWALEEGSRLKGKVNGLATARAELKLDDFILEMNVRMESGRACGVAFRCDEPFEIANWLRLDFAQSTVELHRTMFYDSSLRRYKLKQPSLIQSALARLRRGEELRLRVLACQEYIEVSINGVVYLSAATYKAQSGNLALWVEEGTAQFWGVTVQRLKWR